ncbi:MAG TPA: carboxypeptidase-like regulatory domain-containing protein, partial [Fibrobacteria bacterium]|nr:carboxypeptidase-like regulatory domain-containing protein [Fibrobacteria bacterium]
MKSPRLLAKVLVSPTILAALAVLAGCELFTGRTGGGTETESAVVLHNVDGSPAAGARVRLRPADYLADSLLVTEEVETRMDATTDARGAFRFPDLPAGAWRLEADGGNGRGLVADFRIEEGDDGIRLADDTLRPHGSISGTFAERDPEHARYVQIQGMERLVIADPATGSFLVNGLPPGHYHLRFLALQPFRGQAARREVAVASGEVASLDPVALQGETRLAFRVDSGALVVDGVGERNPVLFDNEYWSAEPDNEFAWALASITPVRLPRSCSSFSSDSCTADSFLCS